MKKNLDQPFLIKMLKNTINVFFEKKNEIKQFTVPLNTIVN